MAEKHPPHIQQALNELDGTVNDAQRRAAEKRLAAAGYERAAADDAEGPNVKVERAPQGRRAPTKQQA